MRTITTTIFSWSHSCLTLNYDNENIKSKMRALAAWNNYRGSGAREENSLRDFFLKNWTIGELLSGAPNEDIVQNH